MKKMNNNSQKLNYISLFSSAGVGCFGFKMENFECIATNELLEKRLKVQKANNKCKYSSGYISGDIKDVTVQEKINNEIEFWKKEEKIKDVDAIISTPPCQGISVANHKKNNEKGRNSLVIESIKLTKKIKPKFFVFENVRGFLNTVCTDLDGKDKTIREAIDVNLGGIYNILFQVINFKEYGNNSSRTRTLVIGARKDLEEITPYDVFPDKQKEKTLLEIIGNLEPLREMGQISKKDIYHNFRSYSKHMLEWIEDIKEGQSAFDNPDPEKRPHKIVNGKKVINQNKNADKYARCYWDKVAPCVHTRNDIMASQSTLHPRDNRVFSVRELMKMMTIPDNFNWVEEKYEFLNNLNNDDKKKFLAKEEINIRQSIGEAVPTIIFRQIAGKINKILNEKKLSYIEIKKIIEKEKLNQIDKLKDFLKNKSENISLSDCFKIAEMSNAQRLKLSAYYTRQDVCFSLVRDLPAEIKGDSINILEPSVGVGNFLPLLVKKYAGLKDVNIDVVDIDKNALDILKILIHRIKVPKNITINFINEDFLLFTPSKKYDLVIGNPPFGKVTDKKLLIEYRKDKSNQKTSNIFSFFIEKSLKIGNFVALICPKSLLSAPEFNNTRNLLSKFQFLNITDYGEKGFSGVKIETISFLVNTKKNNENSLVEIESNITSDIRFLKQDYIFDNKYPVWLIYRDSFFDEVAKNLVFDIFLSFRDRVITKKYTKSRGKIRVLKSRNIGNNKIIDIENYDSYVDEAGNFVISKYINQKNIILAPNLTYNPRACFLPKNTIADGSVALLIPKNGARLTKNDVQYYSSNEFRNFYMISKNLGTRSLNIDSNSVYFFGIKKYDRKNK